MSSNVYDYCAGILSAFLQSGKPSATITLPYSTGYSYTAMDMTIRRKKKQNTVGVRTSHGELMLYRIGGRDYPFEACDYHPQQAERARATLENFRISGLSSYAIEGTKRDYFALYRLAGKQKFKDIHVRLSGGTIILERL